MLVYAMPATSAVAAPLDPVEAIVPLTLPATPTCPITTPEGDQRTQPSLDWLTTLGIEKVKPPQNSRLFPLVSLPSVGSCIFGSNESSRAPRHIVNVVFVTPVPSKVRLPALPSNRAQSAFVDMAPVIAIVFANPEILSEPFIEINGPVTLAGHLPVDNGQSLVNERTDSYFAPLATSHECVPPVKLKATTPFVLVTEPPKEDGSIVSPGTFGLLHGEVLPAEVARVQFFESVASSTMFSVNEPS